MSTSTARDARPARRGTSPLTWLGVALLVAGLSILGWAAWQFYGTNLTAHRAAQAQTEQLRERWKAAPAGRGTEASRAVPGDAVALVRIPRLGAGWEYPVLAGTAPEVLSRGVGWYEHTAAPGELGNFAVAGHRVTHGEPFRRLLELRKGDEVVVETREAVHTYRLQDSPAELTVNDVDGGWVLDPVPGRPSAEPERAILTLTTCQDLFHSPDRSVAFATLVDSRKK